MSDKQQYLQALQTRKQIDAWLDLPRCANCENYLPASGSTCKVFGPVPEGAAFIAHQNPCPHYTFDNIPF